ncbi:hypothetical protein B1C78_16650 [Thioalkalivibrio denitrificans]|uniref:Nitrous-oxide reductase n=1 Tax=Thioalkalivibrio denitrificans TaxID=108003 RepID=A0A1V3N876_9GAMM|nr:hypothetical protein [Thioalkalivibrio denitrificans]OOG21032.1 hypothetical protein B1C78_16650 [Thioalkalivibrio denitrificans]
MSDKPHFTTRRGFITALGFGAVSLYGLWAAYGAAPLPFARSLAGGHDSHGAGHGDHGGHGGHGDASHGPDAEAFTRKTQAFIERYRLEDGTVYPRQLGPMPGDGHGDHGGDHGMDHGGGHDMGHGTMDHGAMDHRGGHGMDHGAMDHGQMDHGHMDHGQMDHGTPDHAHDDHTGMDHGDIDHGADDHADHGHEADHGQNGDAIDVYLAAGMWYYLPSKLRVDAGQPYRFRMMALDVSHGASIQFGRGGRMVRLRPGRVAEMDITFHRKGTYLVYCTFYCGAAHDYMQATIEVV